jgi:hypothetical protein
VSQHPVLVQSSFFVHGLRHTVPETVSVTHWRPWHLQHAVVAHDAPSPAQSPATAAGPHAQDEYCAPASPVQKHDA